MSGLAAPCTTGMWPKPAVYRTDKAFRVHLSTEQFPCTVERPRRRDLGEYPANMMAKASSWPGSQSSHTGMRGSAAGAGEELDMKAECVTLLTDRLFRGGGIWTHKNRKREQLRYLLD